MTNYSKTAVYMTIVTLVLALAGCASVTSLDADGALCFVGPVDGATYRAEIRRAEVDGDMATITMSVTPATSESQQLTWVLRQELAATPNSVLAITSDDGATLRTRSPYARTAKHSFRASDSGVENNDNGVASFVFSEPLKIHIRPNSKPTTVRWCWQPDKAWEKYNIRHFIEWELAAQPCAPQE